MAVKENVAELYYNKLRNTTNPGVVLANFFGALHDIQAGKREIIFCNRLLKIYGRFLVYFALLDTARNDFSDFNGGELYAYLEKVCRGRFENAYGTGATPSSTVDLSRMIKNMIKELEKAKPIELPDNFLEDED